jgi:hypothetical protein
MELHRIDEAAIDAKIEQDMAIGEARLLELNVTGFDTHQLFDHNTFSTMSRNTSIILDVESVGTGTVYHIQVKADTYQPHYAIYGIRIGTNGYENTRGHYNKLTLFNENGHIRVEPGEWESFGEEDIGSIIST